ncbi:metallophosphoesterase [Actinotignum timonense]|nr:metallophosphoesterase [Actinotignum timonense]
MGAGVAAGAGCLGWALHEAHRYTLRERVLVLPQVASTAGELRILHLSDMHLLRRHRAKRQFLSDLAERCRPDLVVLTGDHLSEARAVGPLLEALAPLADIPGLFVYGSNDYFAPVLKNPLRYVAQGLFPPLAEKDEPDLPWEEMTAGLEAFGWIDLNNRRARLRAAAWDIDAVGMDDPHIGRARMPRPGEVTDTAEGAAARGESANTGRAPRMNAGRGYLRLGVVHAPYCAALNVLMNDGAALTLAGHTHGGQLAVPGFGALTTNCDLPLRYDSGLFDWPCGDEVGTGPGAGGAGAGGDRAEERLPLRGDGVRVLRGGMAVNVSAGLGTSPYTPVRFLRPPEAIVLRVRGGAE